MEEPLKELLELLNVSNPDINVDRDYISILERINTDFLENSLVKTQPELHLYIYFYILRSNTCRYIQIHIRRGYFHKSEIETFSDQ